MDECWQEMKQILFLKTLSGNDNPSNQEITCWRIDQLKHITQQKEISYCLLKLVSKNKVIVQGPEKTQYDQTEVKGNPGTIMLSEKKVQNDEPYLDASK